MFFILVILVDVMFGGRAVIICTVLDCRDIDFRTSQQVLLQDLHFMLNFNSTKIVHKKKLHQN